MYGDLISLCVILGAILHAVIRVMFPCKAGNGTMSRTLTGMYISAVFIFAVVVADTMQDRPTKEQQTTDVQKSATAPTSKVPMGKAQAYLPSGLRTANAAERSRTVLKEKYFILGLVFVCFAMLYLLSHRNEQITRMLVWVVMAARRLNPFEHDSRMDGAVVDILLGDRNNEETREWVLAYVLSKRGVAATTNKETEKEMLLPVAPDPAGRFSDD